MNGLCANYVPVGVKKKEAVILTWKNRRGYCSGFIGDHLPVTLV